MQRRIILAGVAALTGVAAWLWLRRSRSLSDGEWQAAYAKPLTPPTAPLKTYHLGHSLVGRDMPAMLAQLAGHDHRSQLGWGASLQQHWNGDVPGFAEENAHRHHQPAHPAINSGTYDALIFTEMVELRDAIRWHDSASALAEWAEVARAATPAARLYLYETWHRLDDPAGWLQRIDADLPDLWEGQLLRPAMARAGVGTIHVIPGGQVMAAAVRAIEEGAVPGLTSRHDLFQPGDTIHFNDLGAYLMALTHYAVLYHRSPEGLPHQLTRADGSAAQAMTAQAAKVLQQVVWQVVTRYPATGVAQVR
jgi:hypothetical protein